MPSVIQTIDYANSWGGNDTNDGEWRGAYW